jgi:hypothetical protein
MKNLIVLANAEPIEWLQVKVQPNGNHSYTIYSSEVLEIYYIGTEEICEAYLQGLIDAAVQYQT